MSQTETIRGTMHVVEKLQGETLEDVCKRVVNKHDPVAELPTWAGTWQEYMYDVLGGYAVYKDEVYDLGDWDDLTADDIFEARENADGSISYLVQYYNGGCGLEEAIGYALDNLKKS